MRPTVNATPPPDGEAALTAIEFAASAVGLPAPRRTVHASEAAASLAWKERNEMFTEEKPA
jgi:hypothetical protein